ncbi:hypothetical protein D3C76_853750 [compost metagenome]
MAAATQLQAVSADLNYANNISVFFTKQSHSPHSLSFINRLQVNDNIQCIPDLFIHTTLDFYKLFWRDTAQMRKVKTQTLRLYQ